MLWLAKNLFFSLSLVWSTIAWSAISINRSVGQVGSNIITSREVQITQALEGLLYQDKKKIELNINDNQFSQNVTASLVEWVVYLEAENFSVAQVGEDEVQNAIIHVEKLGKDWGYWKNLKITKEELKTYVARKLKYKKFFQFKTQASRVNITDSEARAYYDKNRLRFGSVPFNNFKENIKSYLSQQYLENRIREWFELLKRKYKVRNLDAVRVKNE